MYAFTFIFLKVEQNLLKYTGLLPKLCTCIVAPVTCIFYCRERLVTFSLQIFSSLHLLYLNKLSKFPFLLHDFLDGEQSRKLEAVF